MKHEEEAEATLARVIAIGKKCRLQGYILDENKQVVRTDILTSALWGMDHSKSIVGQDQVGPYYVSTVFLGIDHDLLRMMRRDTPADYKPLVFETMVFSSRGGENARVCDRYRDWDAAAQGHAYWKSVYEKRAVQ